MEQSLCFFFGHRACAGACLTKNAAARQQRAGCKYAQEIDKLFHLAAFKKIDIAFQTGDGTNSAAAKGMVGTKALVVINLSYVARSSAVIPRLIFPCSLYPPPSLAK